MERINIEYVVRSWKTLKKKFSFFFFSSASLAIKKKKNQSYFKRKFRALSGFSLQYSKYEENKGYILLFFGQYKT